jgi:ADP-L-glycero-D-manno-heptose 6-epimerase
MIIVTGAAGFIASALVNKLNNKGYADIVVADDFSSSLKMKNLENKSFRYKVHRDDLPQWIEKNHKDIDFVFHLGARTDTAEFDTELLNRLNLHYSKTIWDLCTKYSLPLVYASSAATYGAGEFGYSDTHQIVGKLNPLNPYGISKNEFDKFTTTQTQTPPVWAGLKFFNVYGPNEYHKNRMASVVFHAYNQILQAGKLKLFRSHHQDFQDGMQLRDFIYVKDVVNVCYYFMNHHSESGLYNLGTGKARAFLDLGHAVFDALNMPAVIEFIDIPMDIRDKYQYYTQAEMQKLTNAGYNVPFYTLEEGIHDYVGSYLKGSLYY